MRCASLLLIASACRSAPADAPSTPGASTPPTSAPTTDTGSPAGPTRYLAGARHSPLTPQVAAAIAAIADRAPRAEDVFLKVGDSMTVDANALHCFAGTDVDLADHAALEPTRAWFDGGDAAGGSPFDRDSEAAKIGMSVGWSLTGDPAPVDLEIDAVDGRYALIQFGTNDLQLGTTPETAIWAFGSGMLELSDRLVADGIVPLWTTIPPRTDLEEPAAWVPIYDAVIRGVAQAAQTPIMDLNGALLPLDGYGLSGDGVHLDTLDGWRGCVLDADGLAHGNNVRNLLWLEALDRALAARDGAAPDTAPTVHGAGSAADPFAADGLPFTHRSDTSGGAAEIDGYPSCDAGQDESGPEQWYRLEIDAPTRLRAFVFDPSGVDVDLHLLDGSATADGCVQRDHQELDAVLDPGTWWVVVDSYVDAGDVLAGDYLLVLWGDPA